MASITSTHSAITALETPFRIFLPPSTPSTVWLVSFLLHTPITPSSSPLSLEDTLAAVLTALGEDATGLVGDKRERLLKAVGVVSKIT